VSYGKVEKRNGEIFGNCPDFYICNLTHYAHVNLPDNE
jgi:hypothetical protein